MTSLAYPTTTQRTEIPVVENDLSALVRKEPRKATRTVRYLSAPTAFELLDLQIVNYDVSLARLLAENSGQIQLVIHHPSTARPIVVDRRAVEQMLEERADRALAEICEQTGLAKQEIADLLGVRSRSTIYNVLRLNKSSAQLTARILFLHGVVRELRQTRDRTLIGPWLLSGSPSPAELLRKDDWTALRSALDAALAPASAAPDGDQTADEDLDFTSLARFVGQAPSAEIGPPPAWEPRELTGRSISSSLESTDD